MYIVSATNFTCFIAAFGGRQVADKTYFIGLLNNQLQLLEAEITSLTNELEKAERERQHLLIYEQRYEPPVHASRSNLIVQS